MSALGNDIRETRQLLLDCNDFIRAMGYSGDASTQQLAKALRERIEKVLHVHKDIEGVKGPDGCYDI